MLLTDVLSEPSYARRLAPTSLRLYGRALLRFARRGVAHDHEATVEAVRAFVDARLAEVAPQSVLVEAIALYSVLAHLERTGRFPLPLLAQLRRLRPEVRAPQLLSAPWLTREAVRDLCVIAGLGTLTDLTLRVASLTGLRAGELGRLAWRDVDPGARSIVVRWTAARIKTRRERRVPIVAELLEVLAQHPAARETRACGEGLVLGRGPTLEGPTIGQRMERLSALPDAQPVTLQLLRHTRASWWLQAGAPLVKVAAWLGHSPEVCARHYAGLVQGWDPDADRAA